MRRKIVVLISLFMILMFAIGCQSGGDASDAGVSPRTTPIPLSAVISEMQGEIIAKQAGDREFEIAFDGYELNSSGQVATGTDSRVKLTLSDDSIVRLGSNSFFTLDYALATASGQANNVDLDVGKIWVVLQGGSIDIDTESGVASVHGSYLSVQVTATGEVYVTCLEGECTITTGSGVIHLVAGQSALISGVGQPPTPGPMSEEDVEDWLENNPEATVVIPALTQTAAAYDDDDYDGVPNDEDDCPNEGNQGFGVDVNGCPNPIPDGDIDGDGFDNADDSCPLLGNQGYGVDEIGCPNPYPDQDGDGYPDPVDDCETEGNAGYGLDAHGCPLPPPPDSDGDGVPDEDDGCPNDSGKTEPGECGCGTEETDSDGDGTPDCNDTCSEDPGKTDPEECGCGVEETDTDGDGTPDCTDNCSEDSGKTEPGECGCGVEETDSDGDEIPDCNDQCEYTGDLGAGLLPNGCPIPPDTDGDDVIDLYDDCPLVGDIYGTGVKGNGCPNPPDTDGDGVPDTKDLCPLKPGPDYYCGCPGGHPLCDQE